MITLRRSHDRGHADHGWLNTYHSFSFADYYDPAHMGFSLLRVLNEDRVAPGQGFGSHPHRDMEIVSIVLAGELEHQDSMGNKARIRPGEVQRMTAGTGVVHSEYNPHPMQPVHFLQIWLLPRTKNLKPSYAQQFFPLEERRNAWRLVVSPEGTDGSISVHTDARLYLTALSANTELQHPIPSGRHAYLQVLKGRLELLGHTLETGDGARLESEDTLRVRATQDAEALLFDLPAEKKDR